MQYTPLLHVVLHEPEIPPNTGNIARTCVAVAAKLWLVEPVAFRLDDASLKRAGVDYWPELEWELVAGWPRLLERLGERPMWFFSARASRPYTEAVYARGDAVVFGSLNLSNAAAVVCYEAVRQFGGLAPA